MRLPLIAAAALAASVAAPARCETGPGAAAHAALAPRASVFGIGRNVAGRGVSLQQPLTTQSALALSASTGTRKELPEVRLILGVQYTF